MKGSSPGRRETGERPGRSAKEIIVDSLLVLALMTVAGLASNVLPAAIAFLFSLPISAEGYTDAGEQALWLLFAFSAMLVCAAAGFFAARLIGFRQADYRISNKQERKPDPLSAVLPVFLGALAHGAACLPFVLNHLGNLFFAGPVQYIARFLGHGRHALFSADMFDFPLPVKLSALGIYLVLFAAAVLCGILWGFRRRVEEVEWKESAARYDERMRERESEKVWSEKDAEAAHAEEKSAAEIPAEKPVRDKLARETEAFFRALDRGERIRAAFLILGWFALVVGAWYFWTVKTGRELLSPYAAPFGLFLIVPFRPFRLHEKLTRPTYYGEIASTESKTVVSARFVGRGGGSASTVRPRLLVRAKTGGTEEILFRAGTHLPYYVGEKVFRLGALNYPVPCSFDEDERILCPRCGMENIPGDGIRCRQCRAKLGRRR